MCPFKPRSTFLAAWSLFWLAAATATAQSLPTPRHAFDFGYYFVDGKYGPNASLANPNPTYWNEVGCYTSLYYATLVNYDSDFTPVQQLSLLEQSVARAANQGKAVVLALDLPKELASKQSDEPECAPSVANPAWEFSSKLYTNLQEARGLIEQVWEYWPQVQRLELVDEPNFAAGWTKEGIDCYTARIKELLFELHLGQRPIGLTHQANAYAALQGQRISGSQLDWVGVSAYMKERTRTCAPPSARRSSRA